MRLDDGVLIAARRLKNGKRRFGAAFCFWPDSQEALGILVTKLVT
jgi:hypothetical protein